MDKQTSSEFLIVGEKRFLCSLTQVAINANSFNHGFSFVFVILIIGANNVTF
jgi:hypothetical protein